MNNQEKLEALKAHLRNAGIEYWEGNCVYYAKVSAASSESVVSGMSEA